MNIPFLDYWRKRHGASRGTAVLVGSGPALGAGEATGPAAAGPVAELLAECELLRAHAAGEGVELDDSPASLEALDQLAPKWRDDEETALRLGNDAGLYLGTVVVRTVPGAVWEIWPNGLPVVRLASGREIDVVTAGRAWAADGAPELCHVYAEAAES
ncbi:DUF6278 family protein [Streptomyces sp. MJP52]|uniref:DUF6278 family protein n=1 Tax=Streptomyces sp. MJP52 TaxID=2940555 RepID=UPI0024764A1D|nr:DUF6278 family protein [Streptomyces sp. MJP52]MDH6223811.1 hypothetical protein [Streptomyces sp. MJP52]